MNYSRMKNSLSLPPSSRRQAAFDRGHPTFDLMRQENIARGLWTEDDFKPLSRQYEELGLDKLTDTELDRHFPGMPLSMIPASIQIGRILENGTSVASQSQTASTASSINDPQGTFAWQLPDSKQSRAGTAADWEAKYALNLNPDSGIPDAAGALVSGVAQAVPRMLGAAMGAQEKVSEELRSPVAEGNLAYADKGGEDAAPSKAKKSGGKLPDVRHIPGSRSYVHHDPVEGPRTVTPFVDDIPGFDWHSDRNLFNRVPGKKPHPVYKDSALPDPLGLGRQTRKIVSHYEDHLGNEWKPDFLVFTGWYHGFRNYSFRGTGEFSGCQAVYRPDGQVMTAGSLRSTFDYGIPGRPSHSNLDIDHHEASGGSSYRDPDLTEVY